MLKLIKYILELPKLYDIEIVENGSKQHLFEEDRTSRELIEGEIRER